MKIIHRGRSNRFWVGRQITCYACSSIFELEDGDNVNFPNGVFQKEKEQAVIVGCPVCSALSQVRREENKI